MKSQLLEITQNYRICAHPKLNAGDFCTVLMLVGYLLGKAVWESNKPLFPKLPTPNLVLGPGSQRGDSTSHCVPDTFMVTYYLGSSYGGTVTSGPQPQPSPPQPWKREYRSSTLNRKKSCSQMYTKRSKPVRVQRTWAPPSTARPTMQMVMGSGRTWFPWLCPSWGKAHVKRPWGIEMRGSGLHLSTLPLSRVDLSTGAQQHWTLCWKW